MTTSLDGFHITWNLISTHTEGDKIFYEYECPIPTSKKMYHKSVVESPDGIRGSYSVI